MRQCLLLEIPKHNIIIRHIVSPPQHEYSLAHSTLYTNFNFQDNDILKVKGSPRATREARLSTLRQQERNARFFKKMFWLTVCMVLTLFTDVFVDAFAVSITLAGYNEWQDTFGVIYMYIRCYLFKHIFVNSIQFTLKFRGK